MTSLTSLTTEARALLRECLENGGRIRSTLEQEHAQVPVFKLRDLGLLEWAFADGWHLTPAGKLVAELNAQLLASRTYSPPSEDLPSGWYNVRPTESGGSYFLETWELRCSLWFSQDGFFRVPPFRVLGSALPPYSAQGDECHGDRTKFYPSTARGIGGQSFTCRTCETCGGTGLGGKR